jgi:hypothetical protein
LRLKREPTLSRTQQEAAANTAHFYSACLAVCSVVVMLSSCPELANGNIGRRPAIYAMVVASFTLSLWLSELWTAAFRPQAIGSTPRIKRFLAVVRFVQWECSDCLLIATDWLSDCLPHQVRFVQWGIVASWTTFRGPFDLTGNGYFFSWAGVAFSAFLLLSSFPQLSGPLERLRDEVGKSPHPPLMHARASLIAR